MVNIFKDRKYNKIKLINYGFKFQKNKYTFTKKILDNQFELTITINTNNEIKTELIEIDTKELYTLHLVQNISGSFAGKIKEEYDKILADIEEHCFEKDIFKNKQTKEIINYVSEKYNDELEYLWEKFPDNAIARRKDNKKWYLAILTVNMQKLGFKTNNMTEIIDLRADDTEDIINNKNIFKGYHMNKKHWITLMLDESLPLEFIMERIDKSYILAKKNK